MNSTDNQISLIIWLFLFIIPSWAGGLLHMMIATSFFNIKPFWKQLLSSQIIAIFFSGIVYPFLFFFGIFNVPLSGTLAICLVYTGISVKIFYTADWKKYR